MRTAVLIPTILAIGGLATGRPSAGQKTVIVGTVRTAVSRMPIAGAAIRTDFSSDTARTDSTGRFVLRVSRTVLLLGVYKPGYLDFQYPILRLTTDTLIADVELRQDPPGAESYVGIHLPLICIVVDAPDRLTVFDRCTSAAYPVSQYSRRVFKHHPWSLYFGAVGDYGGVLIATRLASAR